MILAPLGTEVDVLDRVTVRLLREDERPEYDRRLREEHYLESSVLVGQSLRYVAELDSQWVALIAFSAPSGASREQQPLSRAARTPPLSESGLPRAGFVSAPIEP